MSHASRLELGGADVRGGHVRVAELHLFVRHDVVQMFRDAFHEPDVGLSFCEVLQPVAPWRRDEQQLDDKQDGRQAYDARAVEADAAGHGGRRPRKKKKKKKPAGGGRETRTGTRADERTGHNNTRTHGAGRLGGSLARRVSSFLAVRGDVQWRWRRHDGRAPRPTKNGDADVFKLPECVIDTAWRGERRQLRRDISCVLCGGGGGVEVNKGIGILFWARLTHSSGRARP